MGLFKRDRRLRRRARRRHSAGLAVEAMEQRLALSGALPLPLQPLQSASTIAHVAADPCLPNGPCFPSGPCAFPTFRAIQNGPS
jgi:hypothetical protein